MTLNIRITRTSAAVIAILGLAAALALAPFTSASATHQPADKIAVSGSGLEVMSTGAVTEGAESDTVSLGSGTLRASGPSDWIITLTAECALWTDVTTVGNDNSRAHAQIEVWIEHTTPDGSMHVIPVASDDDGEDAGRVVFCNRAYQRTTSLFDDEDATIDTFLETRTANAFQWITLDVGSGVHTVEAKAQITRQVDGTGRADGAVGKRTLVIDPVKLANDASI